MYFFSTNMKSAKQEKLILYKSGFAIILCGSTHLSLLLFSCECIHMKSSQEMKI